MVVVVEPPVEPSQDDPTGARQGQAAVPVVVEPPVEPSQDDPTGARQGQAAVPKYAASRQLKCNSLVELSHYVCSILVSVVKLKSNQYRLTLIDIIKYLRPYLILVNLMVGLSDAH